MGVNGSLIDLTGRRFRRLAVVARAPNQKKRTEVYWLCRCDCGAERVVRGTKLRTGATSSCGQKGCAGHDLHKVAKVEHRIWSRMLDRCHNKNNPGYKNYGARGITVCQQWRNSFQQFLSDVGPRPSSKHSLDRYPNNDGNYEPGNVRWATQSEQMRNTRKNLYVEWEGKRRSILDVCEELGVGGNMVRRCLKRGYSVVDALMLHPYPKQSSENIELAKALYQQADLGYKVKRKEDRSLAGHRRYQWFEDCI